MLVTGHLRFGGSCFEVAVFSFQEVVFSCFFGILVVLIILLSDLVFLRTLC